MIRRAAADEEVRAEVLLRGPLAPGPLRQHDRVDAERARAARAAAVHRRARAAAARLEEGDARLRGVRGRKGVAVAELEALGALGRRAVEDRAVARRRRDDDGDALLDRLVQVLEHEARRRRLRLGAGAARGPGPRLGLGHPPERVAPDVRAVGGDDLRRPEPGRVAGPAGGQAPPGRVLDVHVGQRAPLLPD